MDLYPCSQLGTKNDIINQAIAGDSVITLANGAFYSDLGVKDFGVVFAPYLFRSWDDIEKLAQSDWWEKPEQNVKNQTGLTIVGKNWHYGVRNTLTRKKVESPSDLKGKKIRPLCSAWVRLCPPPSSQVLHPCGCSRLPLPRVR